MYVGQGLFVASDLCRSVPCSQMHGNYLNRVAYFKYILSTENCMLGN